MNREHEDALEMALQRERRAGYESPVKGHGSLVTSCILCKQLHRPEQQFEFHPICPVCIQTSE